MTLTVAIGSPQIIPHDICNRQYNRLMIVRMLKGSSRVFWQHLGVIHFCSFHVELLMLFACWKKHPCSRKVLLEFDRKKRGLEPRYRLVVVWKILSSLLH